jgi:fructose-bisphosphate aldolase class II
VTLVATSQLVASAAQRGTAVFAFNVITLEHAEAIASGVERLGGTAILQVSHNAVRFHHGTLAPIAAACAAVARASSAALSLHLDHVEDMTLLRQAADCGFSSAMFDAGALPYPENVAATRAAVSWARGAGLWLEAELGFVGGKPQTPVSAHAAGVRTDPEEARAYVAETGVDALAVAVGSSHAMTERTASLDQDLIAALRERVPVPLVLHGSSGVGDADLRAAVRTGIRKINVGTALNAAFTAAVREQLGRSTSPDPRSWLAPARDAVSDVVAELLSSVPGAG